MQSKSNYVEITPAENLHNHPAFAVYVLTQLEWYAFRALSASLLATALCALEPETSFILSTRRRKKPYVHYGHYLQ